MVGQFERIEDVAGDLRLPEAIGRAGLWALALGDRNGRRRLTCIGRTPKRVKEVEAH